MTAKAGTLTKFRFLIRDAGFRPHSHVEWRHEWSYLAAGYRSEHQSSDTAKLRVSHGR